MKHMLFALVLAGAAFVGYGGSAFSQDLLKKPAIVGTWHVIFERPPGPAGHALVTFTSDGTSVRTTNRSPVMSPSHGVWKQINDREFQATWNAFQFDEKGNWIGNQNASFIVRFAGADLDWRAVHLHSVS